MKKAIGKSEIEDLPIVLFGGTKVVIDTEEQARAAIDTLSNEKEVGFDTETRPTFKKGSLNKVALVQISTRRTCYLFRLNKMGLPDCLIDFLQNKNIMKVGLSLSNDFLALHRRKNFVPENFVDLQDIVKNFGIEDLSLQKIFAIIFSEKISKSQRLTNWESGELEEKQKGYAATDAWACLEIYYYLKELKHTGNADFFDKAKPLYGEV